MLREIGNAMTPVRILIVDDHPLFCDGVQLLMESLSDMQVIGVAKNGQEALAHTESLQSDLILMDIKMPDMNGIEATRRILQIHPHIRILMLTMFEDDALIISAIRAGARGYLLKGASQAEILRAIYATANGEAIFSPAIAEHVIDYFHISFPN